MIARIWRTYVTDVQARTNAESRAWLATTPPARHDRDAIVVLVTVAVTLLLLRFYGSTARVDNWVDLLTAVGLEDQGVALRTWLRSGAEARFHQRVFWAAARVVAYFVIPIAVVKLVLRGSLRDHGMRLRGILPQAGVYAAIATIVLPLVVVASFGEGFQRKYPYYAVRPDEPLFPFFYAWELLYALQFVGLEFFYRGFLVHGLRRRAGYVSVFVMMVPYVMIHFGKPFPEAFGAILAGFGLGTLSLKSGSVWWGAALHIVVAWTMDTLSLWHRGLLFG